MEIKLQRKTRSNKSTIGDLFINGEFQCHTLEDFDRGLNQSDSIDEIK